ncbi:MAG: DNA internalization-related competence protein ComEC/Rec2 [Firmicutes bacterium]|nr:DNA internalization-related competence protein ComEC/Rec2 [Bacillota bacterium]
MLLEGRVLGSTQKDAEAYRLSIFISSVDEKPGAWGKAYVYGKGCSPAPGSILQFRCRKSTILPAGNANAFDYRQYLLNQGIVGSFSLEEDGLELLQPGSPWHPAAWPAWLHSRLEASFSGLEQEQAALLRGVFLGDKEELDDRQESVLGLSGIAHAFAVSGLHVSFVVLLANSLAGAGYRKRWQRLLVLILFLLFYVSLTGIRPSILRAVGMTLLTLLGQALDEPIDLISTLSITALFSLLRNPLWLMDAGFQLSYGAVLGIYVYQKHWSKSLSFLPRAIREAFSTGLAAASLTLPLSAHYFYHISWLGILLSPLAILAAGLSVSLSMFAAFCALFSTWLGSFLLQAAAWPMELLYHLAEKLSALPYAASLSGAIPWPISLSFLLLLLFLPRILTAFQKSRGKALSSRRICTAASLLLLLFSILPLSWSRPIPKTTEIVFLDVGQGDATLILTEDAHSILIDGGGSPESGTVGQHILLPYLKSRGIKHIDLLISSHPDQDHIDGLLSVLEEIDVELLGYSALAESNSQQEKLLSLARAQQTRLLPIRSKSIKLGESTELLFYPPLENNTADDNAASLVCMLRCRGADILFTGDAPAEGLKELSQHYDLQADILHLPHHGSISGYSPEFYAATGSKIALLSVVRENNYGHPADLVVEYWQERGCLYRTDLHGAVTVQIHDGSFQITTNNESDDICGI